jgi:hypothetical protein
MGLFGSAGLKSAFSVAALVGQDIVARSIQLTSTAVTSVLTAGGFRSSAAGPTGLDFSDGNATNRISWGNGQFITQHAASGRLVASGGLYTPNLAIGAGSPGTLVGSSTAPTISSGFGAGAAIIAATNTFAFTLSTGAASATGVIGFPAATTGWALCIQNLTSNTATQFLTKQTATTTTTATIGNYDAAGASANWGAADTLLILAHAF